MKNSIKYPPHWAGWRLFRPEQLSIQIRTTGYGLGQLASPTSWCTRSSPVDPFRKTIHVSVCGLWKTAPPTPPEHIRIQYGLVDMQYYPTVVDRKLKTPWYATAYWVHAEHKLELIRWMDTARAVGYYKGKGRTVNIAAPKAQDPIVHAISEDNKKRILELCKEDKFASLEGFRWLTAMSLLETPPPRRKLGRPPKDRFVC